MFVFIVTIFTFYLGVNFTLDLKAWAEIPHNKRVYWAKFLKVCVDGIMLFAFIYLMGGID